MSIIRYKPWSLLHDLQSEINSVFGNRSLEEQESSLFSSPTWNPAVDIKDDDDKYVLIADLPGVDPKNIEISMEHGVLTIKGEKHSESREEDKNYTRIERFSGSFFRKFTLLHSVDENKISAKTKNGVLEIIIPKTSISKKKTIQISHQE